VVNPGQCGVLAYATSTPAPAAVSGPMLHPSQASLLSDPSSPHMVRYTCISIFTCVYLQWKFFNTCAYSNTYLFVYIFMYAYLCINTYINVYLYIYIYIYIYTYVCVHVHTRVYLCIYLYIYIYTNVCFYVYVHFVLPAAGKTYQTKCAIGQIFRLNSDG